MTHGFVSACLAAFLLIGIQAAVGAEPFSLDRRVPCDTSRLLGTPDPPPPYVTRRVFERLKLAKPVFVVAEPGSKRLLVVEHDSRVLAFKDDPAADKADIFLGVPDYETYAIAFHPDYVKNGQVFVFAHGPNSRKKPPAYNRIYRFEARGSPRVCDPKSQRLVIEWASNGHSGGDLLFGPDRYLYITSGDGTPGSDTDITGQDLRDLCSGILRIDIDRPDPGKAYSVPKDNPYWSIKGARPELYAIGLRNPWRMTLDPRSQTMWIGDVGQDAWEMIYALRRGGNYGWSVYEGSHPFYLKRKLGPGAVVLPAAEHPHAEARSITGGVFHNGARLKELRDTYIYGDYSTGRIWGLRHENTKVTWHNGLARTRLQIAGFGLDHAGDLLIVDYSGQLHTLDRAPARTARADWPRKLSATGLFTSTAEHRPHPGLIPYSVNSPLWGDMALKDRFIALPGLKTMTFNELGPWGLPEGTVLVKTFSLEGEAGNAKSRRRVETRLLTFQEGDWQGYSYQWNDAQTDADLVAAGGLDRAWALPAAGASGGIRKQTWHYPSRTECMVCHVRSGFILGINTAQLNKIHDYGSKRENQLVALTRLGAAAGKLAKPPDAYARLADPYDARGDLTARARSYLHANCAHCHVDEAGGNSAINLHFATPLNKTLLVDVKPLHEGFGLPDARLVAPGAPERSVLLHRIATVERGRMPPLATAIPDRDAVALIREWIGGLKPAAPVGAAADQAPAKNTPPKPLPKEIAQAWKDAGAEVGWMRADKFGLLQLVSKKEGVAGDLPAFKFAAWKDGLVPKLPAPPGAFGLYLFGSKIRDTGLKDLAGLKGLQGLSLRMNEVTDAGLRELAVLKNLQSLNLGFTYVTDAGLKELAALKSLQALELFRTQVTDAGLRELAGLKDLRALDIGGTRVTDMGLKVLAGLKKLQALNLNSIKMTDMGLKELAELKNLQALDLRGTPVTDLGLKNLAGLKSLRTLDLRYTRVTEAGLKELRKALPRCTMSRADVPVLAPPR